MNESDMTSLELLDCHRTLKLPGSNRSETSVIEGSKRSETVSIRWLILFDLATFALF